MHGKRAVSLGNGKSRDRWCAQILDSERRLYINV